MGAIVGRLPLVIAVASLLSATTAIVLAVAEGDNPGGAPLSGVSLSVGTAFPLVGAFLVSRRPGSRLGWLCLLMGTVALHQLTEQVASYGLHARPDALPQPVTDSAAWVSNWIWAPIVLAPSLIPLVFPGLPPGPSARRTIARVMVALAAVAAVSAALHPGELLAGSFGENPLGIEGAGFLVVGIAVPGMLLGTVGTLTGLGSLIARHRRAQGRERAQLQWLLVGALATSTIWLVAGFAPSSILKNVVWGVGAALFPVAILVAVLRERLFDIEAVLNRTVVLALLSAIGLVTYTALVAAAGLIGERRGVAPLAAAVVAALAASVRARVQRAVDRGLFGARSDPIAVVEAIGLRLERAADPAAALTELAHTVRTALKLPSVTIRIADGTEHFDGQPVAEVTELPMVVEGRREGSLLVGQRHRGERFSEWEMAMLKDVARRAAALAHAARLTADLQLSRERSVLAHEEERRRLRRDVHDGLGPALAGMVLQVEDLELDLEEQPELRERVQRLREHLQATVGEVRRIVENLRPAVVDELGLVEALHEHARRVDGARTRVTADVAALPALPAAIEVAAYRIASEALTNALRHADAGAVAVRCWAEGRTLIVEIVDDGRGLPGDAVSGVGLANIYERAAEVGGAAEVRSDQDGTTVRARFPLEVR